MHEIVTLFKKGVPRQKKVYQKYMEECKVQNFSYMNFKTQNIALIEIKESLMSMDEFYYLSPTQIENMFEYLKENLSLSSFSKVKKLYKQLNELSDYLSSRYNSETSLHGAPSRENCYLIINKIDSLRAFIAKSVGYTVMEIENVSSFESIVGQILNPKDWTFDEEKLYFLLENMRSLFMHDRNNRTFNDNLCKQVEKAKLMRDNDKLKYYKSLFSYLSTIKALNLDEEYLMDLFEMVPLVPEYNLLDNLINKMPIHRKTGKRVVNNFILSIDNDDTKKIDDAFSINRIGDCYVVGIHIADVFSLGYFEEDSLDVNQKNNVNKSKASLNRNKERDAVSLFVQIDKNGLIRDYRMLNTTLVADINLVYEDIPKILNKTEVDPRLKDNVINLISVYNLLENTRFPLTPTIQNLAYVIVSKLMVLCGSIFSNEFTNRNIPAIYLAGNNGDNYCSVENLEFETGFKDFNTYSRVTSPIIDRTSLINQFFIHKCIFSNMSEERKGRYALKLRPIVDRINKTKENEKKD